MKYIGVILGVIMLLISTDQAKGVEIGVEPAFNYDSTTPQDTIPIKDNRGDFITDPNNNPFDITPSNIEQKVEYDPESGQYIIMEKIGDDYYRTPTYMTFSEYMDWKKKQQERAYFDRLAGFTNRSRSGETSAVDPMDKVQLNESLVDRLFGGREVNIQPQGQVDVILQSTYYNNFVRTSNRRGVTYQWIPLDPDVRIKVNVDGNIGKKLNLGFNYDTQSTFDFDREIKLDYDTESFGEDDIIRTIEAGNVSLPLRSNLIQGAQSLFGLKTQLQFGHLRLTAIASQQQSEQSNLRIENGASVQEFVLTPVDYDENRHFFLSHYNRASYEENLEQIPQLNTPFRITQLEVWVSEDRPTYQENSSPIAAITDLGEGEVGDFTNTDPFFLSKYGPRANISGVFRDPRNNEVLPDNRVNKIYDLLEANSEIKAIDKVSTLLNREGFQQNRDFEIFNGRKLRPGEYTYNEKLGFISLNIRLRPNQVLAVSYEYRYTNNPNEVYKVGTITSSEGIESSQLRSNQDGSQSVDPPNVTFTKLLKSTQQRTDLPAWDLMMKNVYSLRATNVNPEDFTFDVFYEDDQTGTLKKFIPEEGFRTRPLLQEFGLDRLNRFNDPQPDGIFDYVPGVTIVPSTGAIIFPVLEPFGSALDSLLGPGIAQRYKYQSLYDTSITIARQNQEFNKFRMVGEVKSATSGEISLGPFIPEGSVRVTAGGVQLVEGRDYEIDYSLGRLRIINEAFLQQGTPINVSFENQALFSLQQKTMLGLRADYEFNDNLSLGATFLRLSERPFTQKVNIGEDPILNKIFGLDLTYSSGSPFITRMVDKLPFYSTKEPSSVNFTAEGAFLKPGHSRAINVSQEEGGVVNIDDFEGAINGLFLSGFNSNEWALASTPTDPRFPESQLVDNLDYGVNRALLNWYVLDRGARNQTDTENSYSRYVSVTELFDRNTEIGQNELITFDLSYYPQERGPYNFDRPEGTSYSAGIELQGQNELKLKEPETRWGGIMRAFQNPDFEAANYEFIEFWMLNPFMERPDGEEHLPNEDGEIVFNLGNVSEDIVKDNLQFFENAIPLDSTNLTSVKETKWGKVPLTIPVANGFDVQEGDKQDLGYNGLTDEEERVKYEDFLQSLIDAGFPSIPEVFSDPANDNFVFDRDDPNTSLITRYKRFNNPQGNAPVGSRQDQIVSIGNRFPDAEDLNNNRSLDLGEGYYKYTLPIVNNAGEIDTQATKFLTQVKRINRSNGGEEIWYRFRIPITQFDEAVNINGFRSIQFMRMFMTGFSRAKTFRLAEFQIVRNLWRKSDPVCNGVDVSPSAQFTIDEIGVEENTNRVPFGYQSPPGIQREQRFGNFQNTLLQDEKSMLLNFCNFQGGCEYGINKVANLDLNLYKRLQLFAHLEEEPLEGPIEDGDVSVFVRFGKDLVNHYYEYELPLSVSRVEDGQTAENIWKEVNKIDVALEYLRQAKMDRIEQDADFGNIYEMVDPENPNGTIRIKGTPNLGYIKVFEIGIRNKNEASEDNLCGEVWVNELRATGLNEKGGYAAQARMQIQMADLGEINLAGSYSSIGWGALDQSLIERNREELVSYDIATSLQLGRFFGQDFGLNIPFYAQYSKNIAYEQFDPYEGDLTVEEKQQALTLKEENTGESQAAEIEDLKDRSKRQTTVKTLNFTNVQKQGKGRMPWSVSNFSANYAYTEQNTTDDIIEEDMSKEYNAGIEYTYAPKTKYVEPFKKIRSSHLEIIKRFNFNPIPNRINFSTNVNRLTNTRTFRLPDEPVFLFDNQRFFWDRNYGLSWDLTRALNLNFNARVSSIVDELRQTGIAFDPDDRDWINETGEDYTDEVRVNPDLPQEYLFDNFKDLGRNKNYTHNVSVNYTLPIRYLPFLDWMVIKTDYKADYGWTAGSLSKIDIEGNTVGNVIQNNQTRSVKANFSFDKLYSKIGYLNRIEQGGTPARRSTRKRSTLKNNAGSADGQAEETADSRREDDGPRKITTIEKILVRPLLLLRSANLNYREDLGTVIPGFMESVQYLGMGDGFSAPGWDFAFGLQPDLSLNNSNNYLYSNTEWFNNSFNFTDQITQSERQTIDLRISLEPIKDFDVDFDFSKSYTRSHTEEFRFLPNDGFTQIPLIDVGSFEATHWGLSTLFGDNLETYQQFLDNRVSVSHILANGDTRIHSLENPDYAYGYGPESSSVIVPAFLAAYTGESTASVTKSLEQDVSKLNYIPKPNWTLTYDGLSRLSLFKDIFSNFTVRHAYRSTLGVNRFNTSADYYNNPNTLNTNRNYYSEIEIPAVVINEQFAPVLGINMKTKSDFTFEMEYRKARQLRLSLQELSENLSNEIRFGVGYIIKNFRSDSGNRRTRGRSRQEEESSGNRNMLGNLGGRVNNNRGKTLTINLNFSLADNVEYIYKYSTQSPPQPNSGARILQISPEVIYDINENFAMRFFVDYNDRRAKATVSIPRVLDIRGGVVAQLKIN